MYYSEISLQLVESGDPALAMGAIGHIVAVLPVGYHLQHPVGIEGLRRNHPTDQQMHLGQGQGRGFFFNRHWSRTKKK